MMGSITLPVFCILSLGLFLLSGATDISYDGRALKINGQRRILFSGSIHYPRSTPEMWPDLIQKAKDGGLDAIETYVFWNAHEPRRREYDFTGNLDLVRFIRTIQDAGLYSILRIGPYACAEWNYGGFPVWLHNLPGIQLRTDNQIFKDEMQNFTTVIVNMMKQKKLFAPQGGPIIIAQIENEYGNVMGSYGEAGKSYVQWCAKMAVEQNIGVPWIMCMQGDAPNTVINTHNGFYGDSFKPNNPNSPKMWTENWTGWYNTWGGTVGARPTEDLAYAVARFFESGGTFNNYYMYHGGTNFGRTSGIYITTSYDYDAPLDEYGNLRQPKWGHLKQLHTTIKTMEKLLTEGDVSTIQLGDAVDATKYTANGTSGCFLSNKNAGSNATVTFQGNQYFLPAWSVSILPDCKYEVYNSAKINVQTSLMTKMPNEPEQLNWTWKSEPMKDMTIKMRHNFSATQLLEQKAASVDDSDYLWYMTRVDIDKNDPLWTEKTSNTTLYVNTNGPIIHAYINGKHMGSQVMVRWKFDHVFQLPIKFKPGQNTIALLSATVGLPNYGAFFDTNPFGIDGGPVKLTGIIKARNVTMDLSTNQWFYMVGLDGEEKHFYQEKSHHGHGSHWHSEYLVTNTMMTWYKTSFKAPLGEDPVVVDLQGMGKGHAWVNGHSIGRYWPIAATEDGCGGCDYRGTFDSDKCKSNCGLPTQRWYHVPRSFLQEDINTLVLFEELGGDPSQVNFQTVTVGTICGNTYEGNTLELSCQGNQSISDIQFASFGDPQGSCGNFLKGTCEADNSLSVVKQACIGKQSCSINVSEVAFGSSNCGGMTKRLAIQAVC